MHLGPSKDPSGVNGAFKTAQKGQPQLLFFRWSKFFAERKLRFNQTCFNFWSNKIKSFERIIDAPQTENAIQFQDDV